MKWSKGIISNNPPNLILSRKIKTNDHKFYFIICLKCPVFVNLCGNCIEISSVVLGEIEMGILYQEWWKKYFRIIYYTIYASL